MKKLGDEPIHRFTNYEIVLALKVALDEFADQAVGQVLPEQQLRDLACWYLGLIQAAANELEARERDCG